jgi:hypothetical protein
MSKYIIFPATKSPALLAAADTFKRKGYGVVSRPCESTSHLLLPVPSFDSDGTIRGGGDLMELLQLLPKNICIIGGYLPELSGYRCIDLLKDPTYLAHNAAITADCAIRVAGRYLKTVFRDCPVYILGWGRIGKCLAHQLAAMGAKVTIAARKESDRATAASLGFRAAIPGESLEDTRLLFNTVPVPILQEEAIPAGCIPIDLASKKGLPGENVIWARGLPGKDAPESSGRLIADTVLRYLYNKEEEI